MLGCTCRIHLGIQWPSILCSRSYAQHQHGRIQGLCPTLPNYVFMRSIASCSTKISQNSCAPELLAQHKTSIYPCAPEILAQHKTSHQACALGSIPTQADIYISYAIGLCPVYQTIHHVHMQCGI